MKARTLLCTLPCLLLMTLSVPSRSQVVVTLSSPPPNQLYVEDLWDLTLTNTSGETLLVYLVGTVKEASDGMILEGRSGVIELPPLLNKQIDPVDLEPVNVEYTNSEYEEQMVKTGTFKEGNFTICITVFEAELETELGNNCIQQPIIHPSPPQLLTPLNETEVNVPMPVFLWLPPMPLSGANLVSYTIKIIELLDGQVPIESMEANPAFYVESNIATTSFQVPVAAKPFETGKTYAWEIIAFNDAPAYEIGKSQVWSFLYSPDYSAGQSDEITADDIQIAPLSDGLYQIISQLPAFIEAKALLDSTCQAIDLDKANVYSLKGVEDKWEARIGVNPIVLDNDQARKDDGLNPLQFDTTKVIVCNRGDDSLFVAFDVDPVILNKAEMQKNGSCDSEKGWGPWIQQDSWCDYNYWCIFNGQKAIYVKEIRYKNNNPSAQSQVRTRKYKCGGGS